MMKILLAEDSRTSQQLAMFLLEDEGHSVEVANNGLEAVEKSARQSFDLILMDVQMPELDGCEATAHIRQREQSGNTHTPIIAMTAQEGPDDRELCLNAGMDDYISKPLDIEEFSAALSRLSLSTVQQPDSPAQSDLSPPAQNPENSLVNWDVALTSVGGHQSILDSVVEAMLEEGPSLIAQLRQAIEAAEPGVTHRAAHTIRGALRTFRPTAVTDLTAQIEELSASGSMERIQPLYEELEPLFHQVMAELRQSISRNISSVSDGRSHDH